MYQKVAPENTIKKQKSRFKCTLQVDGKENAIMLTCRDASQTKYFRNIAKNLHEYDYQYI